MTLDGALLHWESEDPLPAGPGPGRPRAPGGLDCTGRRRGVHPWEAELPASTCTVRCERAGAGPPRAGGCGEAAEVCTFPFPPVGTSPEGPASP